MWLSMEPQCQPQEDCDQVLVNLNSLWLIFYILSNCFPGTINFHLSVQIFQSCKPIFNLNTILYLI
jgi:hypothetical protein